MLQIVWIKDIGGLSALVGSSSDSIPDSNLVSPTLIQLHLSGDIDNHYAESILCIPAGTRKLRPPG